MDIRLKDGWLTFVVLICVVMLIAVQGVPEAESDEKALDKCKDGVCLPLCCGPGSGPTCCCLHTSDVRKCSCPKPPPDPSLVGDYDG